MSGNIICSERYKFIKEERQGVAEFCIASADRDRAKLNLFGFLSNKNKNKNLFRNKNFDLECQMINERILSIQNCFCEKNGKKNIIFYFINKKSYDRAVKMYLYLIDQNITPLASSFLNKIEYETYDKISLFSYLNKHQSNKKFVMNELFCFINKFQKINFIHNNLHIHNIFVNENEFLGKGHFYIIDLTNSDIKNESKSDDLCLISAKYQFYWDYFTIYKSLKSYLKDDLDLKYLDELIENYIPKEILIKMESQL
jgi:hypothetical protein